MTELRRARQAVARRGWAVGSLLDAVFSGELGVSGWDVDGRLVFANPAARSQLGGWVGGRNATLQRLAAATVDEMGAARPPAAFPGLATLSTGRAAPAAIVGVGSRPRRWFRVSAAPIAQPDGAEGPAGVVLLTADVCDRVHLESTLRAQAQYDPLTGLPNRLLFGDRLTLALAQAQRSGEPLAICLLDLDGFKGINDTLGHKVGDRVLREVGRRLQEAIRGQDTVARLGGDEFALLLGGFRVAGGWRPALSRVLEAVAAPQELDDGPVSVTASVGVTLFPGDAVDAETLLRHADLAMYEAKAAGKNRFFVFDTAIEAHAAANRSIVQRVDEAIDRGEFTLGYQPQVDARRGVVVGMEALVRWRHPVLGERAAADFIPFIQQEDAVLRLGRWVLRTALADRASWRAGGVDLPVSVNLAVRQVQGDSFLTELGEALAAADLGPPALCLEVTEAAAHQDFPSACHLVEQARRLGVTVALDEFGTGQSSLTQLRRLGVAAVKIDGPFVHRMLDDAGDLSVVRSILGAGQAFGWQVIAQAVETSEQAQSLLTLGCDVLQGRAVAAVMSADAVVPWVRAFVADPAWRVAWAASPHRAGVEAGVQAMLHRAWLRRVEAGEPAASLDACRFSAWLGVAAGEVAPASLAHVDTLHRQLHTLAAEGAPAAELRAAQDRLDAALAGLGGAGAG